MTTTDHPLTETAAAELWDAHIPERKAHYPDWESLPEPFRRYFLTAIIRDAYDAGRDHERAQADPHQDPRPWQVCTRDDVRAGDLVEMQCGATLRIGVAHRQDNIGDWRTEDNWLITDGDYRPLRRIPAPTPPAEEITLPTEHPAHITDVETLSGARCAYMALDRDGDWFGVDQDGRFRSCHHIILVTFTLPDGTRARRDGEREDGTPRFIKVREGEK